MSAFIFWGLLLSNVAAIGFVLWNSFTGGGDTGMAGGNNAIARLARRIRTFLVYEFLVLSTFIMLVPFYWMVTTSFKDQETATRFPPSWIPTRIYKYAPPPGGGDDVEVKVIDRRLREGVPVRVIRVEDLRFEINPSTNVHEEVWDEAKVFAVDRTLVKDVERTNFGLVNFVEAWYAPEKATRGQANFARYFFVSIFTSLAATVGTLITGALAAFAFSRFEFFGKGAFFYIVLATMMVPGQILLIPNFLILSQLGWLDTYAALIVPWLASVFTIFLMRQFFLQIPDDLWEAARIDGASHFRYLWQIVVPLSKPVFITAGIFNFLGNWNALLWPLIVTSQPRMRTLMVGLQTFTEEAGVSFHLLMAASTMAILPAVLLFLFLQRFFIEGIARSGLK